MAFEDDLDALEKMLLAKSIDYEAMQIKLQAIRQSREIARMLGPAQDELYASITRGHRKVFAHLENGNNLEAMREAARAIAWFHRRFGTFNPDEMTNHPKIVTEIRAVKELVARNEILQEAVRNCRDNEIHIA